MDKKVDPEDFQTPTRSSAPRSRTFLNGPFIITAVIAVGLLSALAFFKLVVQPTLIAGFLAKNVPPPATVSTEVARTESWVTRLQSVGSLIAIQGIDVAPQVAGVVSEIFFDSGKEVKAGDKLVDLDTSVELADLANFEAVLRQTDADLSRQNDLTKRAFASEATQQNAQAKRDSAAASVAKTKALIAQKHIVAPFAGLVGIRKVELGQFVNVGVAIVSLQQLNPMRVDFPVPENEMARLKIGQTVEVTVDAYPGRIFTGAIKTLDARVAADTRTLLIRAEIPNADHTLLPGMFAKIAVLIGAPHDEVTVPRTAVTYSLYGDSVYVVVPAPAPAAGTPPQPAPAAGAAPAAPNLVVERRFIRVSDTRDDRVSVSEGIKPGDQVVTTGQLKLQNGGRVRIDDTQPLTAPKERSRI